MASRGPTSENSDMENANKPASSWPLKQGPKKWSKHGCDKGTLTVLKVPELQCFKPLSSRTRAYWTSTLNLMKISKLQAVSLSSFEGAGMDVVEPYVMLSLQPTGATRVSKSLSVPCRIDPRKVRRPRRPLDWPSNHSPLRLWHTTKSPHQFAEQLLLGSFSDWPLIKNAPTLSHLLLKIV